MKDRFTLIKIEKEYSDIVSDVFKGLCGQSIDCDYQNGYLEIYHSHDNILEIKSVLSSLETDLNCKLLCYTSNKDDAFRLGEEHDIALGLLQAFNCGFYDFKGLLLEVKTIEDKTRILKHILHDTGINQEFIIEFAECNLNTTKTASKLYMHRNTVIYKLDRLVELRGFDLRSFKDMYILYFLAK